MSKHIQLLGGALPTLAVWRKAESATPSLLNLAGQAGEPEATCPGGSQQGVRANEFLPLSSGGGYQLELPLEHSH